MNTPLTKHDTQDLDLDALMRLAETNTAKLADLVAKLGGAPVSPHDWNGHVPLEPGPDAERDSAAVRLLEVLGYAWCATCGWVPKTPAYDRVHGQHQKREGA